jgi:hypothetical protein
LGVHPYRKPMEQASSHAMAWLDALDNPFVHSFRTEPDHVAGCDDVPLICGQRFQKPPRCALKRRAVLIAHDAQQTQHAQPPT